MFWIILASSIATGVIAASIYFSITRVEWDILGFIPVGFLALFLITFGFKGENDPFEYEYKIVGEIIQVKGTNNYSGNFFLFSGHFDNNEYYIFYFKDNYGIKKEKIMIDYVYLIETDETLYYKKVYKRYKKTFCKFGCLKFSHYEIYLPKNNIIKKINMDL